MSANVLSKILGCLLKSGCGELLQMSGCLLNPPAVPGMATAPPDTAPPTTAPPPVATDPPPPTTV